MPAKAPFFDALNRTPDRSYEWLATEGVEDTDFIDWNGRLMPMNYGDAESEYHAIRNSAAVCDVSPMRKVMIQGAGAATFLDHLLTRPVSTMATGSGQYVVFCDQAGTMLDDAIVHRAGADRFLMFPSDMDHRPWFEQVASHYGLGDVRFNDCTDELAGLAIQGPDSARVVQALGVPDIEQLAPSRFIEFMLGSVPVRVVRMGFTGDLGYELWFPTSAVDALVKGLQQARDTLAIELPGYGLTALQACRLEAGFIVAGWDCSSAIDPQPGFERSPFELGLGWLVNLEAGPFFGREALREQQASGPAHTLRYALIDGAEPVADGTRLLHDGEDVGQITSSAWSWGLGVTVANASLVSAAAGLETAELEAAGTARDVRLQAELPRRFPLARKIPAPLD